ncbi:MAG: hypothetical protein AAGF91_16005, partial [Actinomycetota bacterium]
MRGRTSPRPTRLPAAAAAAATAALVLTAIVTVGTPAAAAVGPDEQTCMDIDSGAGGAAVVNLTPVRGNGTGYGLLISSNVKNN